MWFLCLSYAPKKSSMQWLGFCGLKASEVHKFITDYLHSMMTGVLPQWGMYKWIDMFRSGWASVTHEEQSGHLFTTVSERTLNKSAYWFSTMKSGDYWWSGKPAADQSWFCLWIVHDRLHFLCCTVTGDKS
jgi:hypothetical protein